MVSHIQLLGIWIKYILFEANLDCRILMVSMVDYLVNPTSTHHNSCMFAKHLNLNQKLGIIWGIKDNLMCMCYLEKLEHNEFYNLYHYPEDTFIHTHSFKLNHYLEYLSHLDY